MNKTEEEQNREEEQNILWYVYEQNRKEDL
jgi:hypothetical protein